jgi:hypothetical protein
MLLPRLSLLAFAVVALASPAQAQNWWSSTDAAAEVGKLQELKEKRKVFLNVIFSTTETEINAQQEQTQIRRVVTRALSAYKGLELVGTADQAEFAISVIASLTNTATTGAPVAPLGNFSLNLDPNVQVPLEVTVLVRGAVTRGGTYRPRIVWTISSQNVQGEPGPAAVLAVDGFIEQLKVARGEKK